MSEARQSVAIGKIDIFKIKIYAVQRVFLCQRQEIPNRSAAAGFVCQKRACFLGIKIGVGDERPHLITLRVGFIRIASVGAGLRRGDDRPRRVLNGEPARRYYGDS